MQNLIVFQKTQTKLVSSSVCFCFSFIYTNMIQEVSGAGLKGESLDRVRQVGHVGLPGLVFDAFQGSNLERERERGGDGLHSPELTRLCIFWTTVGRELTETRVSQ